MVSLKIYYNTLKRKRIQGCASISGVLGWCMVSDGQLPVSSPLDNWDGLEKVKAPAPDSQLEPSQ